MTKLGKILVVFIAVMSLLLLAFVSVTTLGGPNWRLAADEQPDYSFVPVPGEKISWDVNRRGAPDETRKLVNTQSLPAGVVEAQKDKLAKQREKLDALAADLAAVQETLKVESAAVVPSEQGVTHRIEQLEAELERINEEIVAATKQGTEAGLEAERVRKEAEERRADAARLAAELAELRTDRYQIEEQQRQVRDLIARLTGLLDRTQRRNEQLRERTTEPASRGSVE